ncbi:oxygenase MpaB family protein [Arthrobacter sp. 35W]|uniref:oxygenase MpaB family protein n=1 Tax=Arthrobacter sp. 35W TaxID=1132441 RepID=UPI0003FC4E2C|nr:oxygenase MpaB family protein [Arthrobacter sp. 35W]
MNLHQTLQDSLTRQKDADPDDWERTFRQMVLFDLAKDMELGNFLSYYRNFAIPSIAETLAGNGEILDRPTKRSYDTAIVIYELIASGLDSDRGQEMVTLLNRVHRFVPGTPEDFRYVLLTLLVVPIRWTQRHGWRQPTDIEVQAATRFFFELGQRMHLLNLPTTFAEAAAIFDDYEATHIGSSPAGLRLMDSTVQILEGRLPRPVRPLTRHILSSMFDDDRLTEALGLPRSTRWSNTILNSALSARNLIQRRRPLATEARFSPGKSGTTVYPHGYALNDIGPANVMGPTGAGQP